MNSFLFKRQMEDVIAVLWNGLSSGEDPASMYDRTSTRFSSLWRLMVCSGRTPGGGAGDRQSLCSASLEIDELLLLLWTLRAPLILCFLEGLWRS